MGRLVLASSSPRRSLILQNAGIDFVCLPVDCDESSDEKDPARLVCQLSARKAEHAQVQEGDIVIAADTVVSLGGSILGKPVDATDAHAMLRALSGNMHTVFTGVTVRRGDVFDTRAVRTDVFFRHLTDEQIERYVLSGDPMDKAGAYGIQEKGGVFVTRIDGDYFNVMGLPLCTLCQMLEQVGIVV